MLKKTILPARLYSLDALRGLAALTVVFWHWQHFFFIGPKLSSEFILTHQPLFNLFFLFYRSGDHAVELFFSLSGFIFFLLYSQPISQGEVSAASFFVRRFTRLYPLHFLTLIFVMIEQFIYWKMQNHAFVYSKNDLFHFILNLFLIPSIGLEKGPSFNQVSWSVSVEFFLYIVFFVVCKLRRIDIKALLGLSVFGFIFAGIYLPFSRGIGYFFLGGCAYHAYRLILKIRYPKLILKILSFSTLSLWSLTIFASFHGWSLGTVFPEVFLFPSTILTLALLETHYGTLGRKISILGDISYSLYLWQFPLQLVFFMTVTLVGVNAAIFNHPIMLVTFFALLVLVSFFSHRYIEMPAQRYLQSKWLARYAISN
jgi:peptidoglycan/LPS O-acetylase OafA/YrhL